MLLDVSETIPWLNTLEMLLVNFTLDWPTDNNEKPSSLAKL